MEIKISGRHMDVTPAIREHASQKLMKLLRFYDRIQQMDVIIDRVDHNQHAVEIIVDAEHATPFLAHDTGPDLYVCIDETVRKLERQLSDHKDRLRNRKHIVS
jgi:putative sigma-54 modulation protein